MKKWIIVALILIMLILVIPIPLQMKDGGSVHYNAILYDIYDIHRIQSSNILNADGIYEPVYKDGIIIKVLGIELFNNTTSDCQHDHSNADLDTTSPYFVGKVLEINEKGFLVEVTNTGNGQFVLGDKVQVNTDLSGCIMYNISDHLRISFDGKVALSYPPQVTNVYSISKTDSQGNPID